MTSFTEQELEEKAVAGIADRTASQQTIVISDCCWIASPAVFEYVGLWSYCGHEFDLSGSRDVIAWSHDWLGFPIDHFIGGPLGRSLYL